MIDLTTERPGAHDGAPDPNVQPLGGHKFRLFERDGAYALPVVALQTEPGGHGRQVSDVRIAEVTYHAVGDRGDLRHALRSAWDAATAASEWVHGRQEVSRDRTLRVEALDPYLAPANGPAFPVEVTWRYSYTDQAGTPIAERVLVTLEFAPRGTPAPPIVGADPDSRGLPAPLRHRGAGERDPYTGFAAIDFGTSASTVALFDARTFTLSGFDEGQAESLSRQLADLLREPAPPELRADWLTHLETLVKEVNAAVPDADADDAGSLADLLIGRMRTGDAREDSTDPLLDAVSLAFEGRLSAADKPLKLWLAPRLLACYDKAFRVPPMWDYQLRQVEFRRPGREPRKEIASTVRITERNPLAIELGGKGSDVWQRLKSKLLKPEVLKDVFDDRQQAASTDNLIVHVYHQLVRESEGYAHQDRDGEPKWLNDLVVTYPTTTPPHERSHLRTLLEHCLDVTNVVMAYDEGVAAGLFFLMQDFGGKRREFGAETLRAQSRRVDTRPGEPPTWRQNMLVIDIGAGTTDLALIRLTLVDVTPKFDGVDEVVQGRFYVIRPEVINSTGHPQLGGDYLTLRVFYWLKAAIVDALLAGDAHDGNSGARAQLREKVDASLPEDLRGARLAPRVVRSPMAHPVPPDLVDALREAVPTHYAADGDRLPFQQLWDLAETAKIELGADRDGDYVIPREAVQRVLNPVDVNTKQKLAALVPSAGIPLSRSDFVTLARPVLARAVSLAGWLARSTLDDPERLDRVMLSGQTSKMPLMREVVTKDLPGGDADATRLRWNPAALTVESAYAKQAAAIGACWGHSLGLRVGGVVNERKELTEGRTIVSIDVDNLRHTLPCSFKQLKLGRTWSDLISGGIRMDDLDDGALIGVRSAWGPLVPLLDVHRPIDDTESIQWGVFRYETYAREQEGFRPDPGIWLAKPSSGRESRVRMQLQIDQNLKPWVNICQGDPHYLVPAAHALDLRADLYDDWDEAEGRLRSLSCEIVVDAPPDDPEAKDGKRLVFPAWPAKRPLVEQFPLFFHELDEQDSPGVPGRLSAPLPAPSKDGDYNLYLRHPGGAGGGPRDVPIGSLHVSRPADQTSGPYVLGLDVRGRATIHRGTPRYWSTKKLRDVERTAGVVFKAAMQRSEAELRPTWEPFNGMH
ncbi:hypothetical protein ABZS66_14000 [Dactylosporangium sp. NPDC005572]|uniref:hypothetical protein n=1 Tax=Dactylosporangium sp. NPDC005572 TaxID=3156889 RepID=UPI0033B01437